MEAVVQWNRQRGVALIVSLVLMTAMTALGVATLTGTSLNEKKSSNVQQKASTFQAAESAIAAVWDAPYLIESIASSGSASNNPTAIVAADADIGLNTDFDRLDANGSGLDIDGTVSIQYCGETSNMGSSVSADQSATQLVFVLVDVNSVAKVANSNTVSDHVQRAAITSVRTNRTGNCPER